VTASASRPFYRLSARWGYTASADVLDWRQRRYAGGAVSESYTERTRTGGATLVRSFGSRWKVRPEIGVRIIQSLFEAEAGFPAPPGDRRRVLPAAGLTLWRPRYETTRFLFGLGRTEDIQTGSWGSLSHGFSSRLLGSDRDYGVLQVRLVPILRPREGAYAFLHARLRASYDRRRFFDLYASSGMSLYARLGEASLLAVRVQGEILGRPEDRSQLLLGLDEGLRGYVPRRFDGTRWVRLNLEARPTLLRRPAFVIAAAAFADGGAAWTPGLTRRRTSYAAGGGLRLGLPRVYNSPILRADLARGFRDRAWQLALGLGQYF
jgi:hypothetical protein